MTGRRPRRRARRASPRAAHPARGRRWRGPAGRRRRPARSRPGSRRWRPRGGGRSRPAARATRDASSNRASWVGRQVRRPRAPAGASTAPPGAGRGVATSRASAAPSSATAIPPRPRPVSTSTLDGQRAAYRPAAPRRPRAGRVRGRVADRSPTSRPSPRRRPRRPGSGRGRGSAPAMPPARRASASSSVATHRPSDAGRTRAARDRDGAVAVGVGLDDRVDRTSGRPGHAEQARLATMRVEIDLQPGHPRQGRQTRRPARRSSMAVTPARRARAASRAANPRRLPARLALGDGRSRLRAIARPSGRSEARTPASPSRSRAASPARPCR